MNNHNEVTPLVVTIRDRWTLLRLILRTQDSHGFVSTLIEAEMQGFKASFTEDVNTGELARFEQQLARINANLAGTAVLNTMESVLEVTGTIDVLGHLQWDIRLQYPAGYGATLQFEISNDQSYLPALLSDLRKALEYYSSSDTQS